MARAIDHLVIAARDLDALADFYRRLGFQVGARNRHPWGTENHIVQFDGAFLELISLGEGFAAPAPQPGVFSFARFVATFLREREGLAMLALRSADAEADRRRFAAERLGDFERFDFSRSGRRADGTPVHVGFSLAFAASKETPDAGLFVCEQKFPENFWDRGAQIHPNGATSITGVAVAAPDPLAAAHVLARFAEAPEPARGKSEFRVALDGAVLECAAPADFAALFGAAPTSGAPMPLARIRVVDPGALADRLDRERIEHRALREGTAVEAFGLTILFERRGGAGR